MGLTTTQVGEKFLSGASYAIQGLGIVLHRSIVHVVCWGVLVGGNVGAQAATEQPAPMQWNVQFDKQEISVAHSVGAILQCLNLSVEREKCRAGQVDELLPTSQLQRAPVVQLRAQDSPENKAGQREHPRVSVDEDVDFIEHYPGISLLLFNFFGGLFGVLIFGIVRDARIYGINSVWRDLVFGLPIPYWMRFVPKDERRYEC